MIPYGAPNAVWTAAKAPEETVFPAELLHIVGYVLLGSAARPSQRQGMAGADRRVSQGDRRASDPVTHRSVA